jgi:hypothetical protein
LFGRLVGGGSRRGGSGSCGSLVQCGLGSGHYHLADTFLAGLDAIDSLGEDGIRISSQTILLHEGLLVLLHFGLLLQGLLVAHIFRSAAAGPLEERGQQGKAGNRRQHAKRGGECTGRWLCRG